MRPTRWKTPSSCARPSAEVASTRRSSTSPSAANFRARPGGSGSVYRVLATIRTRGRRVIGAAFTCGPVRSSPRRGPARARRTPRASRPSARMPRPQRRRAGRRARGRSRSARSRRARPGVSPKSTRNPFTPSSTMSGIPPARVPITARPRANASIATLRQALRGRRQQERARVVERTGERRAARAAGPTSRHAGASSSATVGQRSLADEVQLGLGHPRPRPAARPRRAPRRSCTARARRRRARAGPRAPPPRLAEGPEVGVRREDAERRTAARLEHRGGEARDGAVPVGVVGRRGRRRHCSTGRRSAAGPGAVDGSTTRASRRGPRPPRAHASGRAARPARPPPPRTGSRRSRRPGRNERSSRGDDRTAAPCRSAARRAASARTRWKRGSRPVPLATTRTSISSDSASHLRASPARAAAGTASGRRRGRGASSARRRDQDLLEPPVHAVGSIVRDRRHAAASRSRSASPARRRSASIAAASASRSPGSTTRPFTPSRDDLGDAAGPRRDHRRAHRERLDDRVREVLPRRGEQRGVAGAEELEHLAARERAEEAAVAERARAPPGRARRRRSRAPPRPGARPRSRRRATSAR